MWAIVHSDIPCNIWNPGYTVHFHFLVTSSMCILNSGWNYTLVKHHYWSLSFEIFLYYYWQLFLSNYISFEQFWLIAQLIRWAPSFLQNLQYPSMKSIRCFFKLKMCISLLYSLCSSMIFCNIKVLLVQNLPLLKLYCSSDMRLSAIVWRCWLIIFA